MKAFCLWRGLIRVGSRIPKRSAPNKRSLCSSLSRSELLMKNVTKSNFETALAELRRRLREADFVSIDLEMTGVTSAPWREVFEFDRSDIQYLKIKNSAEKFAVVQFGVCPFLWNSERDCFVAHPHNFYIFPRKELPIDGLWNDFLCQTSSLEFLAKYQFDFNTCINEGISYLSRSQEVEAMGQVEAAYKDEFPDSSAKSTKGVDGQLVRMADILFFERMKNTIREWFLRLRVEDQGSSTSGSLNNSILGFETTFFGIRPAIVLRGLTSRQLRLIKLVVEKHFKDLCYVTATSETSFSQPLLVYTDSAADRDLLTREVKLCQRKKTEEKIKGAIGFRHVIDLLSSERKLIVGHNCFLDLAHVYSKFFGPLPSTVEEFVSALQMHFPYIIDTKLLLNSDDALLRIMNNAGTSLDKAFNLLCPPTGTSSGLGGKPGAKLEVHVDDQRVSNWDSGTKHEAGYDALMTGCVFLQSCFHLGIEQGSDALSTVQNEKLKGYINHLYLSWMNGDIIDLTTGKTTTRNPTGSKSQHPKVKFSRVIILWGEASKLRIKDIRDCFSKSFGMDSVISIYHLDETAAFVQLSKEEFVTKFFELMGTLQSVNSPISVLHPLSKIFNRSDVHAATYEMYKEICGSALSEFMFSDQAEAVGIHRTTRNRVTLSSASEIQRVYTSEKEQQVDSSTVCLEHSDQIDDSLHRFEAQLSK